MPCRARHFLLSLLAALAICLSAFGQGQALAGGAARRRPGWRRGGGDGREGVARGRPGDGIVESAGISYQPLSSLLGTWTAGHTVLGWTGHQQQWRPGTPLPDPGRYFRQPELFLADPRLRWMLVDAGAREAYALTPEWVAWMDEHADRWVDVPGWILFGKR